MKTIVLILVLIAGVYIGNAIYNEGGFKGAIIKAGKEIKEIKSEITNQ